MLITDYGYKDPYVGVVKGVIKSINPHADIVDLTHGVERHNILEAAIMLLISAKYFPIGTIFIVIVDPGVGSGRRAILIETKNYILIGPDNGCLTLLAEIDGVRKVIDISNSKYRLQEVSHTFHGRDIFAPVAAWISKGTPLEEIGVELNYENILKLGFTKPSINKHEKQIDSSAMYIDIFGNIMTNISRELIDELGFKYGDKLTLMINDKHYSCTYETSFSKVPVGEIACYINSWNYFEIAINMGSAASKLGVSTGTKIIIKQ